MVYFVAYLGEFTGSGAVHDYVIANAEHKCGLDFGVAMVRGIGANWLVCLAWWQVIQAHGHTDTRTHTCVR